MCSANLSERRLYRVAPEGFHAVTDERGKLRVLFSDPFDDPPASWRLGRPIDEAGAHFLPPVLPGKIVGIGRNYVAHARELGNPVPAEPVIFLKAPSSVIGSKAVIVLPPQSQRVEYEGEIALVLRRRLRRGSVEDAARSVLGITCACDVTARDLQRSDPTFARAKSFDTFCPIGPAIATGVDLAEISVRTRVNGEERQVGHVSEMLYSPAELLSYASHQMTLEPGDLVLTGTPAGTGALRDGDRVEVEISQVGVLENTVEAWRRG